MKVAFRADASAAIGTGHVRRCLALAQALRAAGAEAVFIGRELGLDWQALVRREGFAAIALPAPAAPADGQIARPPIDGPSHAAWAGVPAELDAAQTAAALSASPPAWTVVDHYAFDARWHRTVAARWRCRVAAIDDLGDRPLAVDLLIDHNHANDHRAKFAGCELAADTPLLGGPSYALLGPAYAAAARCEVTDHVDSIGVFMGGADAAGGSLLALQAIGAAGFDGDVEVVATSAFAHLDALRAAVAARPRSRLLIDLPDLAGFYARHGLQIGAGGGATWERCCIGAPTLALVLAANQRQVLEPLAGMGVLQAVDANVDALAAALHHWLPAFAARRRMSQRAQALVDGRGAARVAAAMMEMPTA